MTRIRTAIILTILLIAGATLTGCDVLPSGCLRLVNQPEENYPPAWRWWVEDDGDEMQFWTDQQARPYPAVGWSRTGGGHPGPATDIYLTFTCAYSGGQYG